MHKVWLINLEEVLGQGLLKETLFQHFSRYLLLCRKGDVFITSVDLSADFINYAARFNGLSSSWKWLLRVSPKSPYSLWESVLHNSGAMDNLKNLAKKGGHHLDPFIETPGLISLSEASGIKTCGTDAELIKSGLIHRLNDKIYFRNLSEKLGIPIAPGFCAENAQDIRKGINSLSARGENRIILKKSFSGGGYGNIAGTPEILQSAVDSWYAGGGVVVEKLMPLEHTLGSLVILTDKGVRFMGLNSQIIENNSWKGCYCPFDLAPVSSRIEKMCMDYGEHIRRMGARGLLNVDFGVTREPSGSLSPFALEINLRRNGFNYVLQVAKRYFRINPDKLKILYYSHFTLPVPVESFGALLKKASVLKLDGEPIFPLTEPLKRGIVFTTAIKHGQVGLLAAGSSKEEIDGLMDSFIRGISGKRP